MAFALENNLRPHIGFLVFDLNLTETHAVENDITTQPIASGANRARHAITRPRVFSCVGLVSSESAGLLDMWNNVRNALRGHDGRHIVAWRQIVEMAAKHETGTVRTTLETLPNMMIKRAEVVREQADGIFVNLTMRQIQVALVSEEYNVGAEFADSAQAAGNLGVQGTTTLAGGAL